MGVELKVGGCIGHDSSVQVAGVRGTVVSSAVEKLHLLEAQVASLELDKSQLLLELQRRGPKDSRDSLAQSLAEVRSAEEIRDGHWVRAVPTARPNAAGWRLKRWGH